MRFRTKNENFANKLRLTVFFSFFDGSLCRLTYKHSSLTSLSLTSIYTLLCFLTEFMKTVGLISVSNFKPDSRFLSHQYSCDLLAAVQLLMSAHVFRLYNKTVHDGFECSETTVGKKIRESVTVTVSFSISVRFPSVP